MLNRWVVACFAVFAPVLAFAQRGLVVEGTVYLDEPGLAVRSNFRPVANVSVLLYRDNGDGVADAKDSLVSTRVTNADGVYAFPVDSAGDYWVAVNSRTVGSAPAWPEQTFGPAGALCARPDGSTVKLPFEGACVGGRTADASDAAGALTTSEHVAFVSLRASVTNLDFAFSYNVVTTTADGPETQGSLRTFVVNANAIKGPNRMRFVPVRRAPEQRETVVGVAPHWWTITLGGPLPVITDGDTVFDGDGYNYLSPASPLNVHGGLLGAHPTMRADDRVASHIENPDLEVVLNGREGIACENTCGIRGMALHGAPVTVAARANMRLEHVIIGAAPDATSDESGTIGLQIDKGVTRADHVLVTAQTDAGIIVSPGARLDGDHLEVSRCGSREAGGGIALLSDGSAVSSSVISANRGAGIIIGSLTGNPAAKGNVIDGCTISSNEAGVVLSPGSSRNVITRNDIMWNRLGGVTASPYGAMPPLENRVSANRFDENGLRPIVLDVANAPAQSSCTRVATAANGGITSPRITGVRVDSDGSSRKVVVSGHACPGEVVEVYQSYVTSAEAEGSRAGASATSARDHSLPSVGEYNYVGATNVLADGTFQASFPFTAPLASPRRPEADDETSVWATDVMIGADATDRAFSAIAIDPAGNTSEMSDRLRVR